MKSYVMNSSNKVTILGAGLAGSLLAIYLQNEGHQTRVIEKRKDPRQSFKSEGRSINLALSHRGIGALQEVGIMEKVRPHLIPMYGRMIHDTEGNLKFMSYGREEQHINSVSRSELNKALIQEADSNGAEFLFNSSVELVNLDERSILINGNLTEEVFPLFGTDGANSSLRKALQSEKDFHYENDRIQHGYKELSIPAINGEFAMEPNNLHIWPRKDFMLIALPNPDYTFTCTLFLQSQGEVSFENLQSTADIQKFFELYFPDIIPLIPDLIAQFEKNPTSGLSTIKCGPWNKNESIVIGDAAHAIVPFYGQGMNASFEDCRLMMKTLKDNEFDWEVSFTQFYNSRKKDADAIADLALGNFLEMRDHVSDQKFQSMKGLSDKMHELFHEEWIPVYNMVTFSDIPYNRAKRLGEVQKEILTEATNNGYQADYHRILEEYKLQSKFQNLDG